MGRFYEGRYSQKIPPNPPLLKWEGTKKNAGPILDEARAKAGITTDEVKYVALHGGIIEDYPDDKRGNSCE